MTHKQLKISKLTGALLFIMMLFPFLLVGSPGLNEHVYAVSEANQATNNQDQQYATILADSRKIVLKPIAKVNANATFYRGAYEWTFLSLGRDLGLNDRPGAFDKYLTDNVIALKVPNGIIDSRPATDYDKLVLALTAVGADVTDLSGLNLFDSLASFKEVQNQGINGVIYTLLALDAKQNYAPSKNADYTKQDLIDFILAHQKPNGGWTLFGNGPDADITAMTLQALAPYQSMVRVKAAIAKAVSLLSNVQSQSGGYYMAGSAVPTDNANSAAQVITALCSLNIDPTSAAFTKNGVSVLDNLLSFYVPQSGFKYFLEDTRQNNMATIQSYYSLISYDRYLASANRFYQMDDQQNSSVTQTNPPITDADGQDTPDQTEDTTTSINKTEVSQPDATSDDDHQTEKNAGEIRNNPQATTLSTTDFVKPMSKNSSSNNHDEQTSTVSSKQIKQATTGGNSDVTSKNSTKDDGWQFTASTFKAPKKTTSSKSKTELSSTATGFSVNNAIILSAIFIIIIGVIGTTFYAIHKKGSNE
ncbi:MULTISPECIES: prenyltransferase/squalene oxidase repeat-containing protein [Amylolactobacillus]|nr:MULTISPECIES: prenyltransferase/squalene oxidase repeat-containing protein [Amylolactobacillus]APT18516.1 hypothetical protein LA20533_04210 [Amylolactobacillus amylophilus DSM 20533 = JCM 1125]GED80355.1 hypothetical protein LAM01_08280 [Amylolactobacillus amylophilus]